MYKIADEIIKFVMKNWKEELTVGGKNLAEAKIQRRFQVGTIKLSP